MHKLLITPPVVFIIVLTILWLVSRLFSVISFKPEKSKESSGDSYACGEENYDHMAQPDYSNFFQFAFFFTIAHVATLIMTTVPSEITGAFMMAAIYVLGAVVGLYILFTK